MNYRKLGRWGVKLSEVGVGGWLTLGRTVEDAVTDSIVRTAFDLGINFFDTADAYNAGAAERALAKAIKPLDRMDLFIATKCFFPVSDKPNDRGLSRKHIFESVHRSLKNLQTDYVDLFQFHRFDVETPIEESIGAIDDLVRQGKVLYWGVSMWQAHQISDAVHTARAMGARLPVSNQPLYNMLERSIEQSVIPACEQHGLGQVVFSPLAQGALTGKYKPGQPAPQGSRGADDTSNRFMQGYLTESKLAKVQQLEAFVRDLGTELPQFALAWCLRQPNVTSTIIGATKPEQVVQNAKASDLKFSDEVWEAAEQILAD